MAREIKQNRSIIDAKGVNKIIRKNIYSRNWQVEGQNYFYICNVRNRKARFYTLAWLTLDFWCIGYWTSETMALLLPLRLQSHSRLCLLRCCLGCLPHRSNCTRWSALLLTLTLPLPLLTSKRAYILVRVYFLCHRLLPIIARVCSYLFIQFSTNWYFDIYLMLLLHAFIHAADYTRFNVFVYFYMFDLLYTFSPGVLIAHYPLAFLVNFFYFFFACCPTTLTY